MSNLKLSSSLNSLSRTKTSIILIITVCAVLKTSYLEYRHYSLNHAGQHPKDPSHLKDAINKDKADKMVKYCLEISQWQVAWQRSSITTSRKLAHKTRL